MKDFIEVMKKKKIMLPDDVYILLKQTAHLYGINNMGYIYPYIFLGYGLAGVLGPVIGGLIFDLSGNYSYGAYIAAILSITGAFILLFPVNSNKS